MNDSDFEAAEAAYRRDQECLGDPDMEAAEVALLRDEEVMNLLE